MLCSIEGCKRPSRARGWCINHYRRYKRNGDPVIEGGLPRGEAAKRTVIRNYKQKAKRSSLEVLLTEEEFTELFKQNCHYCGSPPSNRAEINRLRGSFIYNGVDRVDSTQGYHRFNVVPCCARCNWMKADLSEGDFIEHVKKIHGRLLENGESVESGDGDNSHNRTG